ncbi:hypothetical protein B0T10DRAFT_130632 [Thelonectria olida]|uniref:Uncharacterized protein n=1 Tax=Thelonectria olida TaxID=1576542 RepID=A0A9P8W174_9HYPO|nr:hypothetical protein B0T10DRAFT_130632 [Thelonectria olida]
MSRLVDDVKTTLKGVKGAGDAVRGDLLDATDKAFEKDPTDPTSVAKNTKNQAIREKGKQDVRNVDEMVARHEWNRKAGAEPGVTAPGVTAPAAAGNVPATERFPAAENVPVQSQHQARHHQAPALETSAGEAPIAGRVPATERHAAGGLDETYR